MSGGYYDYDEEPEVEATTKPLPNGAVNVTIEAYGLQHIANCAADKIAGRLENRVAKMVDAKLDALLDEKWRENIAERAQKVIDEYFTKPRAKTNMYGESTGGVIALSEKIPEAVKEYMQQRVNERDGSAADGYSRNSSPTRLEYLLKKQVTDQLKEETEKAAKTVTEKARLVVQNHVARFISEQMVPAIEVNKK